MKQVWEATSPSKNKETQQEFQSCEPTSVGPAPAFEIELTEIDVNSMFAEILMFQTNAARGVEADHRASTSTLTWDRAR